MASNCLVALPSRMVVTGVVPSGLMKLGIMVPGRRSCGLRRYCQ